MDTKNEEFNDKSKVYEKIICNITCAIVQPVEKSKDEECSVDKRIQFFYIKIQFKNTVIDTLFNARS